MDKEAIQESYMACIMNIYELYGGINKLYRGPICPIYANYMQLNVAYMLHICSLYGGIYAVCMRIYASI